MSQNSEEKSTSSGHNQDDSGQPATNVTKEGAGPECPNKNESPTAADAPVVNPDKDTAGAAANTSPKPEKINAMKVDILLKPAGDAPIMKKKKWTVDRSKRISWVSDFIKKYIKSDPSESLFLYVNQAFAPSPDTEIGTVFDCFGSDGKLVLHYCRTQAWG